MPPGYLVIIAFQRTTGDWVCLRISPQHWESYLKGPFIYYERTQGWVDDSEMTIFPYINLYTENVLTYLGISSWLKMAPKHPYVIVKWSQMECKKKSGKN